MNLTGTPALTLLNPWAHLIAHNSKRVENRSWMPPERITNLFIHAGKGWDDDAEWMLRRRGIDVDGLTTSAIVAVADLTFACGDSRFADELQCGCDPEWAMPGQDHWNLGSVWTLPEPVPARGRQGLWVPPPDVVSAVEIQVGKTVPR